MVSHPLIRDQSNSANVGTFPKNNEDLLQEMQQALHIQGASVQEGKGLSPCTR
jgi:hypothetical protein